jgi:predicted transcriptional regulator
VTETNTIAVVDNSLHSLTGAIVSAFVSNNPIQASQVPDLVSSVFNALSGLGTPVAPEVVKLEPPISIKKSVTPDYLISMEDGRQYKTLKRHLTLRGLTPADYRAKWGLPADYPMTAPSYSAARSALAQTMGLGRKAAAPETVAEAPKPKRPKKDKAPALETTAEETVADGEKTDPLV